MTERKHIKRISYQTQQEDCRSEKTAFYEKVKDGRTVYKISANSSSRAIPSGQKVLMCREFGGQCMPNKCKDMRVIKQEEVPVEE